MFKSCSSGALLSCALFFLPLSHNTYCSDSIQVSSRLPQSKDSSVVSDLEKMVVTADRQQKLLEASHSLSIIRAEEWAGTNKSIADIIAEQTGVQTRKYGGTGSFQTVTVRGVQGDNVLVLLDGIPLNSAMGGAVDLSAISPDRIGEIEVYKGITPSEFGGNATGGVINLKSRNSTGSRAFHASAAIGAYGYHKFSAEANHAFSDQFRLFGSLNYISSDNNWPYLNRNKTPANDSDDRIDTVKNHKYDFFEARLHPSMEFNNGRTLSSGIAYSTSDAGIPAAEGSVNRTAKHSRELFDFTARLSDDNNEGKSVITFTPALGYLRWSSNTFWTSQDESMGPDMGDISMMKDAWIDIRSVLQIYHISCITDLFFSENLGAQITLQGKHSDIGTETHSSGYPVSDWPGNSQEASLSADVNYQIPAGKSCLGATAGGAIRGIRSATKGGTNQMLRIKVLPSATIEYPWSVHAGAQWRVGNSFNLFFNTARYAIVPGLREKYGMNGALLPSPDLKAETGIALEGGARLMAGETRLEAVVFRTETRNGTMMVSDGRMSKAKNYASGLVTGLETSLQARFFRFLGTELRATLQKAENRSKAYEYYGKRLPNEPDLSIIAGISLGPFKGIEPEYWLDFKSPFFRDPGNVYRVPDDDGMPGMVFHNARITWKAGSRFGFGFSIRNFNGISLRSEEMIMSNENGYSWILYPSNEWCVTAEYSF